MNKDELRQRLRESFLRVQSQSPESGYQEFLHIDPEALLKLLEDVIESLPDKG